MFGREKKPPAWVVYDNFDSAVTSIPFGGSTTAHEYIMFDGREFDYMQPQVWAAKIEATEAIGWQFVFAFNHHYLLFRRPKATS